MSEIRITRLNAKTGRAEEPARERGLFILGDPAFGQDKKLARHAVRVSTLEKVIGLLGCGFHLRMTDGRRRSSLICPDSISVMIDGRPA